MVVHDASEPPSGPYEDPFTAWALGPGRDAYLMLAGEDAVVPLLVDLGRVGLEEFMSGQALFPDGSGQRDLWRRSIQVPDIFSELEGELSRAGAREADEDTGSPAVMALVPAQLLSPDTVGALKTSGATFSIGAAIPAGEDDPQPGERPLHHTRSLSGRRDNSPDAAGADRGERRRRATARRRRSGIVRPTITAVIDDGIAFAHERFRNEPATTRMEYLWVQGAPSGGVGLGGREFDKTEIDALLATNRISGQIEEDAVYAQAGVLDYGRRDASSLGHAATHGTSVMDLAGGLPWQEGEQDNPLVGVQLPVEAVRDTSLGKLEPWIYAGLVYVLLRSLRVSKARGKAILPVVINLSFGNTAGPHDGRSVLEMKIDRLLRLWNRFVGPAVLTLPSGNSRQARIHAAFSLPYAAHDTKPKKSVTLPWRVLPDDKTPSSLEVWMPAHRRGCKPRARLRVVAPGGHPGEGTDWLKECGGSAAYPKGSANPICTLFYTFVPWTRRGVFTVYLHPTAGFDTHPGGAPKVKLAPSGLWRIEIEILRPEARLDVEAWVQRDDTSFTFTPLGRQSYFDAGNYRRFARDGRLLDEDDTGCIVKRDGSMNAIATGCEPVVIGGLVASTCRPAAYSAGGPTSADSCAPQPERTGPDAVTISDDSSILLGVMSAGARSGSVASLGGTSMASACVAWVLTERAIMGQVPDRKLAQALANPLPLEADRVGEGLIPTRSRHPSRRS